MAQIGFTKKQEAVYDRFNALRLAYQAKHGRTYAPGFLAVLMDAFEAMDKIKVIPFSPDMDLSDFVKTVVKSAIDSIEPENETE